MPMREREGEIGGQEVERQADRQRETSRQRDREIGGHEIDRETDRQRQSIDDRPYFAKYRYWIGRVMWRADAAEASAWVHKRPAFNLSASLFLICCRFPRKRVFVIVVPRC